MLHNLSPETMEAYAHSLYWRRYEEGAMPEVDELMEIGKKTGANPAALLVLARWEL